MAAVFLIMSEKNKFTNIAVVGLGYVGLPLCIRFCESGLKVIGLDVDQDKVEAINAMFEVTDANAKIYPA